MKRCSAVLLLSLSLFISCSRRNNNDVPLHVETPSAPDLAETIIGRLRADFFFAGDTALPMLDRLATQAQLDSLDEEYPFVLSERINENVYALRGDIDSNGREELVFLQQEGSMRNDLLYICRWDSSARRFRLAKEIDDHDLRPFRWNDVQYFVERSVDFRSKRLSYITAGSFSSALEFRPHAVIEPRYSYTIPAALQPYVRQDFLSDIATCDLSHLLVHPFLHIAAQESQLIVAGKDTLTFEVNETSVGYKPTVMQLYRADGTAVGQKEQDLYGFDIVESGGKYFVITAYYDDRCRAMNMTDMAVSVYELPTYRIVAEGFLTADIDFVRVN